jgi:hypothetical protein
MRPFAREGRESNLRSDKLKKLIVATALLGALCLPALAGGGNDQGQNNTIIRAVTIRAAVTPLAYQARSLALVFLS